MSFAANEAMVAEVAGRTLRLFNGGFFEAKNQSRANKLLVGDLVSYEKQNDGIFVNSKLPRTNCLARSFENRDKQVLANIDRLFVIGAPAPLFNAMAIDRVLAIAHQQQINCVVVVNKVDLLPGAIIDVYQRLGIPSVNISAKYGTNFECLLSELSKPDIRLAAFCGVSGVGKSTIVNRLVPEACGKTSQVSWKTGQGKQTTSQVFTYPYLKASNEICLIADLPGIQHFGVSHLSREEIRGSFAEFSEFAGTCAYSDCQHLAEPVCGVKIAVNDGLISRSRYDSYLSMISEIVQMPDSRKYRKDNS